jgi:hypothetical protein
VSEQQSLRMVQVPAWGADAWAEDPLVEDYLDHLCAPLVGIVPLAERRNLRLEVRSHLEALAADYGFEGKPPAEATATALLELGEPWQVGQTFLREWLQGRPDVTPARLTRQATLRAFAFFGVAAVFNWLLIEQHALNQPLGDLTPWIVLLAALSPLIAGTLLGFGLPARMGRGLCWALGILIVHALAASALLLPQEDGFGFALCLALWWLPAGWLSAMATTHLVRSHHRQRFLKGVR